MDNKKSSTEVLKEKLATNIARIRFLKGETQEEFASRFDNPDDDELTSARTVRKWESAQSLPRFDKVINLAKNLGVTIENLLSDEPVLDALIDNIYNYFKIGKYYV